jgi:hypothetical protein
MRCDIKRYWKKTRPIYMADLSLAKFFDSDRVLSIEYVDAPYYVHLYDGKARSFYADFLAQQREKYNVDTIVHDYTQYL